MVSCRCVAPLEARSKGRDGKRASNVCVCLTRSLLFILSLSLSHCVLLMYLSLYAMHFLMYLPFHSLLSASFALQTPCRIFGSTRFCFSASVSLFKHSAPRSLPTLAHRCPLHPSEHLFSPLFSASKLNRPAAAAVARFGVQWQH